MNVQLLERQFARIGARAKVHPPAPRGRWRRGWQSPDSGPRLSVDIASDREGEYFDITLDNSGEIEAEVVDVQPRLRHLLLMSRQENAKHKFLCGHDERHWFVAAVPEQKPVASVRAAFDVLKPTAVHDLEDRLRVKPGKRNRRRNAAFIRQGEWFFVPFEADGLIKPKLVLHHEPISRGRGKPHWCEEVFRDGGELVYVNTTYRTGLTEAERRSLFARQPTTRNLPWTPMRRNPRVFARGRVRHPDHKTIFLDGWHEVLMNTENQAAAMRHVAFLD